MIERIIFIFALAVIIVYFLGFNPLTYLILLAILLMVCVDLYYKDEDHIDVNKDDCWY